MSAPVIEVSHLAASSSFYSAVLQPLGLACLEPSARSTLGDRDPPAAPSTSIAYGYARTPLLYLRQRSRSPAAPSTLALTAPSRRAVVGFHACALRANPQLPGSHEAPCLATEGGVSRATAYDLDGNKLDIVYPESMSQHASAGYAASAYRTVKPPIQEEPSRVLDWHSEAPSAQPRRITLTSASYPYQSSFHTRPDPDFYKYLPERSAAADDYPPSTSMPSHHYERPPYPVRRSATHSEYSTSAVRQPAPSTHSSHKAQPQEEAPPNPRQSSTNSNLNTTTVVGALLGVAAGAAVAYGLVSRERERKPRHEVEAYGPPAPSLPRRATFPEKVDVAPRKLRALEHHPNPQEHSYMPRGSQVVYPDVVDDYAGVWPSNYLTEGSQHYTHSTRKPTYRSQPQMDDYDTRSRHSTRQPSEHARSRRARSEVPVELSYPPIVNAAPQSRVSTRRSVTGKSSHSRPRSHAPVYDEETYISARTHQIPSARPRVEYPHAPEYPPAPEPRGLVIRGRPASRIPNTTTTAMFQIEDEQPAPHRAPPGRGYSQASAARHVPLPQSDMGSSHAEWDDDDNVSIAPSDSISCAGSRTSRRSRRHHHRYHD
jgi:hypothetical protein